MRETNNLKLNLLDEDDFVDITPINENTEKLDSEVTGAKALLGQLGQETNASLAAITAKNNEQDTLIAELDENISALEQSAATKQSGFYSAQHSRSGTVHNLSVQDPPASGVYSVRFTAMASFAEGDTMTLNGAPLPAVLINGEALPDKLFTEGAVVCAEIGGGRAFFRAGGLGYNDELPIQPRYGVNIGVESGVATVLPEAVDRAHAGNLFVYKRGETAPASPKDGTVVDLGKAAATDITGLENDVKYTGRLFAYNSKKQLQTIYNERSFYPSDYAPGNYSILMRTVNGENKGYDSLVKHSDTGVAEWTLTISEFMDGEMYQSGPAGGLGFNNKGELMLYAGRTTVSSVDKRYRIKVAIISPNGEVVFKEMPLLFPSPEYPPTIRYGLDGHIYVTAYRTVLSNIQSANITIYKFNMDLELIYSMDVLPLAKMSSQLDAGHGITDYQGRLYIVKGESTAKSLIRLTDTGEVDMEITPIADESLSNPYILFSEDNDYFILRTWRSNKLYYHSMNGEWLSTVDLDISADVASGYNVFFRDAHNIVINECLQSRRGFAQHRIRVTDASKYGIFERFKVEVSLSSSGTTTPLVNVRGMNLFKNDYPSSVFVYQHTAPGNSVICGYGSEGQSRMCIPIGADHWFY